MKYISLKHRFVRLFPENLEPGILYVSVEFNNVTHVCCCGCGEEVSTPLSPAEWQLTYDGRTVSLSPSIGSWQLPCKSHYFIRQGRVLEAGRWSDDQIALGQRRDQLARERQFVSDRTVAKVSKAPTENQLVRKNGVRRLIDWILGK